ncbi:Gfo/Idh/MocA family protein [Campylobacter sp. MIT 97-5078]|uniref:Gfo/Idh/MocA family protein n=1 Tax=Campylobacter sp. MIT 97-5078 TaxID=1548153 RepID=UPI0005129D3C|nr:Gfo/Idh/MocA family oxidoreductase [Campylobacter sp. MIT 97-5078]KGI55696.1 oxidoreductase [Campylobacter sp. MIT 97-5078]TQR27933.1 gfo/Idh/MocA family oxidoreductase [Campylobacter sp. MIT 97-5078]
MKIGIAGLGKMGQNHLKELQKNEQFQIYALYDTELKQDFNEPFFSDLAKFLAQNLDIVIISSPTKTHLALAKEVFKSVKCVLIEKPLALNLVQMKELESLAKEYGVRVAVGFSERFNPCIVALKELLHSEKIISIDIQRFSPYPQRISDVGVLQDLAVHDLDLIAFLSGQDIKHCELKKLYKKDLKREDEATQLCECDGFLAYAHQSWNSTQKLRRVSVITENAFFEANLNDFILLKNDKAMPIKEKSPLLAEHEALIELAKLNLTNEKIPHKQERLSALGTIQDALAVQKWFE